MNYLGDMALVVAALAVGYFFLYRRYLRPLNKQFQKLAEMQNKFLGLFCDFEDMMDGFEAYVEELREEFAKEKENLTQAVSATEEQSEVTLETRTQLEALVLECQKSAKAIRSDVESMEFIRAEIKEERARLDRMATGAFRVEPPAERTETAQSERPRKKKAMGARHERVMALHHEGHDATQIAQMTGFARGEVQLILAMGSQSEQMG